MVVKQARRFELPSIQALNKDQDAVLALPLEGQHLIVGGPGTGKSVVALLRSGRLMRDKGSEGYRFLAYNKLLYESSLHLFGDTPLKACTLIKWFCAVWGIQLPVPKLPPNPGSIFCPIDWSEIEVLSSDPDKLKPLTELFDEPLPHLVIDEGQDMPPAFYRALAELGFENFYVVADQSQQIHPETCSTRQEIADRLGIDPSETLELRTNYRNTRPIAQLAAHFYTGDPASPKPELPNAKPSARKPELWCYGAGTALSLEEVASRILQMSDRDPKKLIGVIAPNNKVREKFLSAMSKASPDLDNGRPFLRSYHAGSKQPMEFDIGGIMVLNAQACKGLEFETVVLADIDEHQPKGNVDVLMKRFYVMSTRARDQVIMLRCGKPDIKIEQILPKDQAILARREDETESLESPFPF